MKRRRFLQVLGASVTAPALSVPSVGRAAAYPPAAVAAAISHAQSRAVFSVWGLAKALGLEPEQAEALMHELARRGVLGPVQGVTFGGRWASSKVLVSQVSASARLAREARSMQSTTGQDQRWPVVDLGPLMAHLRRLVVASQTRHAHPPLISGATDQVLST